MKTEYFFFWKNRSPLSNWYKQQFIHKGITFNCSEQAFMYEKALLFGDRETAAEILKAEHPSEQKALGRKILRFDDRTWDKFKYDIVKDILRSKFSTILANKNFLKSLKGKIIVEASPFDRVWGIGYEEHNAMDNIDDWGENLLGKILTELSEEL